MSTAAAAAAAAAAADGDPSPYSPFLTKLFDMVDNPTTDPIVGWSRSIDSFVLSNFVRQLNTYMDYQEQFLKEQMEKIHNAIEEKERVHEKQLRERVKAKQFELNSGADEDILVRREEASRFIDSQVKGVKEFEAEREKLVRAHQEKTVELRRKFLEDEVELEKEFEAALTKLMEKHTPTTFQVSSSS